MVLKLLDLIRMVRIKLNEDPSDEGMAAGVGHTGLTLGQVIASVAEEEIRQILEATVFTGFDDLQKLSGEIRVRDGVGRVPLPGDFYRLVELKISGWERPVTEAVGPSDRDYWRRNSASRPVRGTYACPRAYISEDSAGRCLELHPCEQGAEIEYGDYLSNPWLTPADCYYIPDRMAGPVTSAIARRVREIINQS